MTNEGSWGEEESSTMSLHDMYTRNARMQAIESHEAREGITNPVGEILDLFDDEVTLKKLQEESTDGRSLADFRQKVASGKIKLEPGETPEMLFMCTPDAHREITRGLIMRNKDLIFTPSVFTPKTQACFEQYLRSLAHYEMTAKMASSLGDTEVVVEGDSTRRQSHVEVGNSFMDDLNEAYKERHGHYLFPNKGKAHQEALRDMTHVGRQITERIMESPQGQAEKDRQKSILRTEEGN